MWAHGALASLACFEKALFKVLQGTKGLHHSIRASWNLIGFCNVFMKGA